MTRIDFYILSEPASEARWHFACRLVDKALRSGTTVLLNVDSQDDARLLDDLLWTFKPETFIPHDIFSDSHHAGHEPTPNINDEATDVASVVITAGLADHQLHGYHGLLINLGEKIPTWFSRFERVSEIVIQDPAVLKNTRDHFSFYRERGYPIEHRNIS